MELETVEKIIEEIKKKPEAAALFIIYAAKRNSSRTVINRTIKNLALTKRARGVVAIEDNDTAWVFADYIRKRGEKVKVYFAFPLNIDKLEKY